MNLRYLCFSLLLVASCSLLLPGETRGAAASSFSTIQINADSAGQNIAGDRGNEPSLAVDPGFPNRIVVGWRQFDTPISDIQTAWGFSEDGGRTWSPFQMLRDPEIRSDPVLASGPDGRFFFFSLQKVGPQILGQLFRSLDGGQSWGPPVPVIEGDKPWLIVDKTGGVGHGNLYLTWASASLNFARSFDRGLTWAPSDSMPEPIGYGSLDVDSNGTVYVAGVHGQILTQFSVVRSSNAWDSNQTPTFTSVNVDLGGEFFFPTGGAIPNQLGLQSMIWVAVDHSRGPGVHVYLLAATNPPGPDRLDIFFARSTDGAQTWSAPLRVNDDPPDADSWQWFPTMSVSPNGRIDLVWNDTRESGTPNLSRLYYSCSNDGGLTWSGNQVLSPEWDSRLGIGNNSRIGDYYHMVSDAVGAHLVWAATFNGEQDTYYSRIGDYDCNGNGVGDSTDIVLLTSQDLDLNGIPDECQPSQTGLGPEPTAAFRLHPAFPNPSSPGTSIRFTLPEPGATVTLRIFDVSGRPVRTLADGYLPGGIREVSWDGRGDLGSPAPAGLYLYRLQAPGFSAVSKLVLWRK